ncbi:MAG: tandem-95 repeat protein [Acidobacteria bacterium]|nr:tandem-95 repeat protein [Acidobacteriota bacterium]
MVEAEDPDGEAVTYSLASGGVGRFAVGSADGAVRYVGPGEDYETEPNRYEMTVRARDPHGAEAQALVVVVVVNVNEPPEAEDDEAETAEDVAVVVDVLANDTDPDGDALRVRTVSAGAHGSTAIGPRGVVYTPEANYHGTDRFTYVASDGGGETAEAAVQVTVAPVNDAPVAVGVIPDQTLDEGGAEKSVDLRPFFEDIDGDALSYHASSSDAAVAVVSVAGAVVTLTPVVYGSAVVTVTAEDPEGLTAEQTFAVGVSDRLVRAVLGDTLAAMARSHLASARMALGRRASTKGADGSSRLTVLGRPVPLDSASAQGAAAQLLAGWVAGAGGHGGFAAGSGLGQRAGNGAARMGAGSGGMRPATAAGPNGVGQAGGVGGFAPGGTRGVGGLGGFGMGMDPWRGSEFQLALGGQTAGAADPGRSWQVWGTG